MDARVIYLSQSEKEVRRKATVTAHLQKTAEMGR